MSLTFILFTIALDLLYRNGLLLKPIAAIIAITRFPTILVPILLNFYAVIYLGVKNKEILVRIEKYLFSFPVAIVLSYFLVTMGLDYPNITSMFTLKGLIIDTYAIMLVTVVTIALIGAILYFISYNLEDRIKKVFKIIGSMMIILLLVFFAIPYANRALAGILSLALIIRAFLYLESKEELISFIKPTINKLISILIVSLGLWGLFKVDQIISFGLIYGMGASIYSLLFKNLLETIIFFFVPYSLYKFVGENYYRLIFTILACIYPVVISIYYLFEKKFTKVHSKQSSDKRNKQVNKNIKPLH